MWKLVGSTAKSGGRKIRLYLFSALFASLLALAAISASSYAAAPASIAPGMALGAVNHAPTAGEAQSASARESNSPSTCSPNYQITQSEGATPVAGTSLVSGSQCDDCLFNITLPFTYSLYNHSYSSVTASSNGQLDFSTPNDIAFVNNCLPDAQAGYAIFPFWADMNMSMGGSCTSTSCGVFTSITGSAPNRVFNIEYRAVMFASPTSVNFTLRLYEGQQTFDLIYQSLATGGGGRIPSVGVQQSASDGGVFAQYQCPGSPGSLTPGSMLTFTFVPNPPCLTATPTRTPTSMPVSTATPTRTPIMMGHGTWDGRPAPPNPAQQLPISLTLRLVAGGPYIDYPFQNTDASGYFTEPVGGLPAGTYYWRAWGPHFLANSGTIEVTGVAVTDLEVGLLLAADADGNNMINTQDFLIDKIAYNGVCGDPNYQQRADFNGDCAVNVIDFNLLRNNFGLIGAPQIGSGAP